MSKKRFLCYQQIVTKEELIGAHCRQKTTTPVIGINDLQLNEVAD